MSLDSYNHEQRGRGALRRFISGQGRRPEQWRFSAAVFTVLVLVVLIALGLFEIARAL